jgi:hypothetical protein
MVNVLLNTLLSVLLRRLLNPQGLSKIPGRLVVT